MSIAILGIFLVNIVLFTTPISADIAVFDDFNRELVEEYKRSIAWEEMGNGRSVATP